MFPILLSLHPLTIYTIGVFMLIAFLVSGYVFWRKGREEHYQEEELFDAFLLTTLWGAVWARIGFVIINFGNFGFAPLKWLDCVEDRVHRKTTESLRRRRQCIPRSSDPTALI